MPAITVDSDEIKAFLNSLKGLAKPHRSGDGSFSLSCGGLRLGWAGAASAFTGTDAVDLDEPITVLLPERAMFRMRAVLPKSGPVRLAVAGDRLYFNKFSLNVTAAYGPGDVLLPLRATAQDVAEMRAGRDEFGIANAGLEELAWKSRARQVETVAKAARQLAWLGVTPELLGGWVDAHLAARARGHESFKFGVRVADRRGQFGLFGGDVEA